MDINFSKEDIAFRDEVRDWLANDYPKHVKEKTDNGIALTKQDMIDYHKAISKKGGWAITGLLNMVALDGHQLNFTFLTKNLDLQAVRHY